VEVTGRRYKTLSCSIHRKAYCDKVRTLGKSIIFTDDLDMPVEEMVDLYTGKNVVEEQFKQLKISFTGGALDRAEICNLLVAIPNAQRGLPSLL